MKYFIAYNFHLHIERKYYGNNHIKVCYFIDICLFAMAINFRFVFLQGITPGCQNIIIIFFFPKELDMTDFNPNCHKNEIFNCIQFPFAY
jgi:hypothetical protein